MLKNRWQFATNHWICGSGFPPTLHSNFVIPPSMTIVFDKGCVNSGGLNSLLTSSAEISQLDKGKQFSGGSKRQATEARVAPSIWTLPWELTTIHKQLPFPQPTISTNLFQVPLQSRLPGSITWPHAVAAPEIRSSSFRCEEHKRLQTEWTSFLKKEN